MHFWVVYDVLISVEFYATEGRKLAGWIIADEGIKLFEFN